MAAKKQIQFSLETIERIKRHKGIAAIYGMTDEERTNLINKLENEAVISAVKASSKHSINYAFGKQTGELKGNAVTKLLSFADMVNRENKALVIDSCEMLQKSAYAFLQELNEKYSIPVVLVSSHPHFQFVLHESSLFREKAVSEIDWKLKY